MTDRGWFGTERDRTGWFGPVQQWLGWFGTKRGWSGLTRDWTWLIKVDSWLNRFDLELIGVDSELNGTKRDWSGLNGLNGTYQGGFVTDRFYSELIRVDSELLNGDWSRLIPDWRYEGNVWVLSFIFLHNRRNDFQPSLRNLDINQKWV